MKPPIQYPPKRRMARHFGTPFCVFVYVSIRICNQL